MPFSSDSWVQRLDTQLVVGFLVASLLPTLLVGTLLTWGGLDLAERAVLENVARTADAYGAGLDLFVQRQRGGLARLAQSTPDENTLTAAVQSTDGLEAVWDPDRALASQPGPADWAVEACRSLAPATGQDVTHAGAGHAHEVVIRVESESGVLCGQLTFTLHQQMLTEQATSFLGGSAYIVDPSGTVVCHTFDDHSGHHDPRGQQLSEAVSKAASSRQDWVGRAQGEAGEVVAAYAPSSELEWGVWVEVPVGAALGPFWTGLWRRVLVAAAIAGLAAGLAVLLARRLAAPVRAVAGAVGRLTAGELGAEVPVRGPAEVAVLAREFNTMSHALARSHAELEARVEARTAELQRAHARLAHQEKVAALGTLAAGLAHEIGNPLASMSSELEMLERVWDPDDARSALPVLREQVGRMARLLRELVDLGRPPSQETSAVDARALLDEVARLLRHDPRSKGILVTVDGDVLPPVHTQRDGLLQVLVNLGLNALDALSGQQGGRVALSVHGDEQWCIIDVWDNGPGLPPDEAGRVFDPFFTTKAPGQGTGLGLFVSTRIMQQLNGRLEHLFDDSGTRFRVTLPVHASESQP